MRFYGESRSTAWPLFRTSGRRIDDALSQCRPRPNCARYSMICSGGKRVRQTLRSRIFSCSTDRRAPPQYLPGLAGSSEMLRLRGSLSRLLSFPETRQLALGTHDKDLNSGLSSFPRRRTCPEQKDSPLHGLSSLSRGLTGMHSVNLRLRWLRVQARLCIQVCHVAKQLTSESANDGSVAVEIDGMIGHRLVPIGTYGECTGVIRRSPDAKSRQTETYFDRQ